MKIIGINAFHADSSACLVIDGKLISAVEEERFHRIKHWAGFPIKSIKSNAKRVPYVYRTYRNVIYCLFQPSKVTWRGRFNFEEVDFLFLRYCCTERIGTYNFETFLIKNKEERMRNVDRTYRNVIAQS